MSIFLCGRLPLECDDEHEDADDACEPERDSLEHGDRTRLERHRLEEEDGLEPLAVDAREAEEDEPDDLRGGERETRAREDTPLLLVEALQVLLPVDAMVEPVEDQEQHADRDERDDGLQLLAVSRERREDGLRDRSR